MKKMFKYLQIYKLMVSINSFVSIAIFFTFLGIMQPRANAFDCEVSCFIKVGFDFANGRKVYSKIDARTQRVVWVDYGDASYLVKSIYEKYKLGHDKPILTYYSTTGYLFSWFNIVTGDRPWWMFWRHDYYILRYKPIFCCHGPSCYSKFFTIVNDFSPPKAEVQAMYKHCVFLNRDYKKIIKYLQERYNYYNTPRMKKLFEQYLKTGNDELIFNEKSCTISKVEPLSRFIINNRNGLPKQLPNSFLELVVSPRWYYLSFEEDRCSFMMLEYFFNQSDINALFLALDMTKNYESGSNIDYQFRILSKNGLLDKFVVQAMPKDLSVLPELPTPKPASRIQKTKEYYENTYKGLVHRDVALQMTFNAVELRKYWKNKLNRQ